MKDLIRLAVIGTMLVSVAHAQSVSGQLKDVNPTTNSISVNGVKGEVYSFRTKVTTEVIINGKRSTLKDLATGASIQVTKGETDYAARIISPAPGSVAKPAAAQSTVKIPATAVRTAPIVVGGVSAGQKVSISPKKVWWTGGGSRKGSFCDWKGYESSNVNGHPWMALIAAVGASEFAPDNGALSFTVPADGILVLFANDGSVEGNEGQAQVTVSINPK